MILKTSSPEKFKCYFLVLLKTLILIKCKWTYKNRQWFGEFKLYSLNSVLARQYISTECYAKVFWPALLYIFLKFLPIDFALNPPLEIRKMKNVRLRFIWQKLQIIQQWNNPLILSFLATILLYLLKTWVDTQLVWNSDLSQLWSLLQSSYSEPNLNKSI